MMLEARKENKVYSITEQQKDRYLKEGFDIYEDGKVIEYTPKKVIKYSDHLKILEKTKANAKSFDNVLDLLKDYAENKNIELGQSSTADGILKKILEAEKE